MISRREFLAGTSALALMAGMACAQSIVPFGGNNVLSHNGGKAQVNTGKAYAWVELPFINVCKSLPAPWNGNAQGGTINEDQRLLYDTRGYPTRFPSVTGGLGWRWETSGLYIYGKTGDVWVLDWPGSATLRLINFFETGGLTQNIINANRVEYTITGTPSGNPGSPTPNQLCSIHITAMATDAFAGGQIRLYKKSLEQALNQGRIFDPVSLARMAPFGAIRFADWMNQTLTPNAALSEHRRPLDNFNWFGMTLRSDKWCGNAAQPTLNDLVVSQPSSPATIQDGQMVTFLLPSGTPPIFKTCTAATNATDAVFTCVSHGLTTGDIVEWVASTANGSWGIGLTTSNAFGKPVPRTCTVLTPDTFTLGVNSTTWGAYPGGRIFYKQVTLTVGALATKPCLRMAGAGAMINPITNGQGIITGFMTAVYNAAFDRWLLAENTGGFEEQRLPNWGPPWEVMVALCNEIGAHPWFELPVLVTDAYVTAMATYVRDNLAPSLIPRWEWGNEGWSPGYWVYQFCGNTGPVNSPVMTRFQYMGFRLLRFAEAIEAVFGARDYKVVASVQTVALNDAAYEIELLKCPPYSGYVSPASPGDTAKYPGNHIGALVYFGYIVPAFQYSSKAAAYPGFAEAVWNYKQGDAQTAFDYLYSEFTNNSADSKTYPTQQPNVYFKNTAGPYWKALTASYGIDLYEYEGGHHVFTAANWQGGFPTTFNGDTLSTTDVNNLLFAFLDSNQFGQIMVDHGNDFIGLGGTFPSKYSVFDQRSTSGMWGFIYVIAPLVGQGNNSPIIPDSYVMWRQWNRP